MAFITIGAVINSIEEKAMNLRKIFIPFAIIASLGALVLTGCGRHHHDPEEKAEWVFHKISKKLDLTDEQKVKLDAVKAEIMQHHKNHRAEKKQMMNTLITEIQKPEIDQAVILDMVSKHKSHVDEVAPGVIAKFSEFHASLSTEQKQKLVKKIEKFKKYHHDES